MLHLKLSYKNTDPPTTRRNMATASPVPMSMMDDEEDSIFEGGFPASMFIDEENDRCPITDKIVCGYCSKIVRNHQQRVCGHMFCRSCLAKLRQSTVNNPVPVYCPTCVAADDVIDESQIREIEVPGCDYSTKRGLNNKKVRCPQPGCTYVGRLYDYARNHELTCPKACLPCPNDCGESVHVAQLAKHQDTECKMRTIACQYCYEEYKFQDEMLHEESCQSRPAECELCRKKGFNRETLKEHQAKDCPKFKCPISCTDIINRKDVDAHFMKQMPRHMIDIGEKLEHLKMELLRMEVLIHKERSAEAPRQHIDNEKVVELINAVTEMDDQVKTLDNICTVFKVEFEKLMDAAIFNKRRVDQLMQVQAETQERLLRLEQAVQIRDVQLMERDLRLKALEDISYDGTLVWRIENFSECRKRAQDGEMTSLYSPAFYTSRCGYKLCARLYLNGDGIGKSTHISFFFVVMRGKYDGLLRWPFQQKVTMMLLDYTAQHHVMDAFRPDKESASFHKPKNEMNVASGCPLFMPLSALNEKIGNHVRDDVAYFKIIVDCSDIPY